MKGTAKNAVPAPRESETLCRDPGDDGFDAVEDHRWLPYRGGGHGQHLVRNRFR